MYNEFSEIYDKLVFDIDYKFYSEIIKNELINKNIIPKNILEVGIGTGRLTKYLIDYSEKYYGIDISAEMLEKTSRKFSNNDKINLINANIVDFKKENFFDFAFTTLDTVNYILDPKDLEKAFRNIYESLKDNSLLIFDINSENKLREVLGNNTYIYEHENIFYSWQNFLDEDEDIVDFVLDFFIEENGLYKRIVEEQSEKIYSLDTIEKMLLKIGFKNIVYKDFDTNNIVEKHSQRILFIAEK